MTWVIHFASTNELIWFKGNFGKCESKSKFKRLNLLKKRRARPLEKREKKREKRKERKEKEEENV